MKKLIVAMVAGVFLLALVAGCGQKEEAVAPVEAPVAEMAPEPAPMENMTTVAPEAPVEAPAEAAH